MSKKVEFLFDVGSPTAYLAYTQLPGIAEKTAAEILWTPILLGGLFKAVGNQSPAFLKPKSEWMSKDIPRFAKRYGVPFRSNEHFPVNTLPLMRGAIAAQEDGTLGKYLNCVFRAMWVDSKKMDDPEIIGKTLTQDGLDAEHIFARVQEQSVKDLLIHNTEEAAKRGAFGAPTFFVGTDMFFGQDRLDFVEEFLST
jgi:2-hydroxychromene-2-carboxylate isomerase